MEVSERLERLRRREELEQRLLSSQPARSCLGGAFEGGVASPVGVGIPGPQFWVQPVPGDDLVTETPPSTGSTCVPDVPVVEPEDARPPEDSSATDPARTAELDLRPAKPVAPEPLAPMVYDVLAALRSVLQRYPGLAIALWPADRATEDLSSAVRLTVDPVTGLNLRMPDAFGDEPFPGAPDAGPDEASDGPPENVGRDGVVPGAIASDPAPPEGVMLDPAPSGCLAQDLAVPGTVAPDSVPPAAGGVDSGAMDLSSITSVGNNDQVVNRSGAQSGGRQPVMDSRSPRSVAMELALLLRRNESGCRNESG